MKTTKFTGTPGEKYETDFINKITTPKQAFGVILKFKNTREKCRLIHHCIGVLKKHGIVINDAVIGDYEITPYWPTRHGSPY
jgi:hypothetical protein